MKNILIPALFLVVAAGCTQTIENKFLDKWEMISVIQNRDDVSETHNPKGNRFITFSNDGTFESGGDPYGKNTGKYFVNNLNYTLYLDSDAGPDDDSIWIVSFEGNYMQWQGQGNEFAEGFLIKYKRSKNWQ
jgi:hypothetical protein